MKAPICRLISPSFDKNWSFQVVNVDQKGVNKILRALSDETVEKARPFIQGNSGGWVMIEFWVNSNEVVYAAAEKLFKLFNQEIVFAEDFTREELGLS